VSKLQEYGSISLSVLVTEDTAQYTLKSKYYDIMIVLNLFTAVITVRWFNHLRKFFYLE